MDSFMLFIIASLLWLITLSLGTLVFGIGTIVNTNNKKIGLYGQIIGVAVSSSSLIFAFLTFLYLIDQSTGNSMPMR